MNPGDAFVGYDRDNHLYIVLSLPDDRGRVALANLTTHGPGPSCSNLCVILRRGDHPWVRRDSCVPYGRSKLTSLHDLAEAQQEQDIEMRSSFVPEVLIRIQQGALDSIYTRRNVKNAVRRTLHG